MSLAAKRAAPQVSLAAWFTAAQLVDLVFSNRDTMPGRRLGLATVNAVASASAVAASAAITCAAT